MSMSEVTRRDRLINRLPFVSGSRDVVNGCGGTLAGRITIEPPSLTATIFDSGKPLSAVAWSPARIVWRPLTFTAVESLPEIRTLPRMPSTVMRGVALPAVTSAATG